jgi:hypothetical protein
MDLIKRSLKIGFKPGVPLHNSDHPLGIIGVIGNQVYFPFVSEDAIELCHKGGLNDAIFIMSLFGPGIGKIDIYLLNGTMGKKAGGDSLPFSANGNQVF